MADQDRLDAYANWIRQNQDKQGTPEWVKVTDAYREMRGAGGGGAPQGGPALADDQPIPVDLGFGLKTSMPNNMLTRGIRSIDQNLMAPLARGGSSVPTMLYDLPATITNWATGKETLPLAAPRIQDTLGIQPRDPKDKSMSTTFLEALGGGFGARGLMGAFSRAAPATRAVPATGPVMQQAAPQTLSQIGKVELAGAAGTTAGQEIGERVGGPVGGFIGGIAGGLTPALTGRLLQYGLANGLPGYRARELPEGILPEQARTPGDIYDAAMRIGVTPSVGLVGSKAAMSHETAAAAAPFGIGRAARNRMEEQGGQWSEALQGRSAALRGAPPTSVPTHEGIGAQVKQLAGDTEARYRREIGAEEEAIQTAIGSRTPISFSGTLRDINAMKRETGSGIRSALDDVRASLRDSRRFNQPNAGRTRRQEIPYEVLRDERSGVGKSIAGRPELSDRYQGRVYDSLTRDLRAGLEARDPDLVDRFNAVTQRNARLSEPNLTDTGGDIPYLRKLTEKSDIGAYQQTFPGGDAVWERIAVLRRGDPQAADRIAGDMILNMGTPKAGQATGTAGFSPDTFLTNWNSFGPRAKLAMVGSMQEVRAIDDLATVAGGMRARDRAKNRSNSATAGAEMGFLSQLVSRPGRALSNMGAGMLGSTGLTNQNFAAYLADRAPTLSAILAERAPAAVARSTAVETSDEPREPLEVTVRKRP